MTNRGKGMALGVIAALLWGTPYVVFRLIFRISDIDAVSVAFARFAIGGIVLAAVLVLRGEGRQLRLLGSEPLPFLWLALTGIVGMGIFSAIGTSLTTATNVSLIMNSNPLFVVLLGPLVGERLTAGRLGGALLGLAGLVLVILGSAQSGLSLSGGHDLWGALAALGAALTWAAYTLSGKGVVRRHGGLFTTTAAMLWGTALLAVTLGAAHLPTHVPGNTWGLLLYLGLLPTALAFALWYRALSLVDASMLAPAQYLAPVTTAILARFLLNERVGAAFVAGLVLIFAGIALATRRAADAAPGAAE